MVVCLRLWSETRPDGSLGPTHAQLVSGRSSMGLSHKAIWGQYFGDLFKDRKWINGTTELTVEDVKEVLKHTWEIRGVRLPEMESLLEEGRFERVAGYGGWGDWRPIDQ